MVDLNATQAAIRAGYSAKAAGVSGPRDLLQNPRVAAVLVERQLAIAKKLDWDVEQIVRRAGEIALENKSDRVAALALLAKRHPAFRDGPVIDQSQHLHLPPGTTLDDLRRLRESLTHG